MASWFVVKANNLNGNKILDSPFNCPVFVDNSTVADLRLFGARGIELNRDTRIVILYCIVLHCIVLYYEALY